MSKKDIEPKLSELMSNIAECEGLIAANIDGKVIIGQTLTDMDHNSLAKLCADIMKASVTLGGNLGKGDVKNTTVELDEGFAVIVGTEKVIYIGLVGIDGRPSLALLKRQLISIAKS